jgi:RNA polymerase-binding transcription factor DksA
MTLTVTTPSTTTTADSHIDADALSRLRTMLVSARTALKTIVSEHAANLTALTGEGDPGTIIERDLADASTVRARVAIGDIDDALTRIHAGTYGACERCDALIPLERLEAVPHARFCVACTHQRSGVFGWGR